MSSNVRVQDAGKRHDRLFGGTSDKHSVLASSLLVAFRACYVTGAPLVVLLLQVTVGADDLTANYRVEQHVEVVEERQRDGKLLQLLASCHKTR